MDCFLGLYLSRRLTTDLFVVSKVVRSLTHSLIPSVCSESFVRSFIPSFCALYAIYDAFLMLSSSCCISWFHV